VLLRIAAALAVICFVSAGARAAEPSPFAVDVPPWFQASLLDFRDEVREAAARKQRVLVYFGQDGCPYCRRLFEVNFGQPDIVAATRRDYVAIALNLWGDRETTWTDGEVRSEKDLARFLRVQFTPTLLFLDDSGRVALRLNGYQPPERFRLALEYAREPRDAPFAAFLAARAVPAPPPGAGDKAARAGVRLDQPARRPTLLLFEGRGCEPCREIRAALRRPEVARPLAALELVPIDAGGTGRVVAPGGKAITERELARAFSIAFPPTLVFLDKDRREVFRVEGYVRPFHLAAALAYVADGEWQREPSFQRYLQAHADRERAAGRPVEIW